MSNCTQLRPFVGLLLGQPAGRTALLGIDYGTNNVGVAIAGSLRHEAKALTTLAAGPTLALQLGALIQQRTIAGLVVGWPLWPDGTYSPECAAVESFLSALRQARVFTPVMLWNEQGSSARARALLRPASRVGSHARKPTMAPEKRALTDSTAAAIILGDFLAASRGLAAQALG